MDAIEKLETVTHAIQFSPNCPSRFLVRLVGPVSGGIDLKPYYGNKTKDILGFGRTLEEAAEAAFQAEHVEKMRFLATLPEPVWKTRKVQIVV